MRYTMLLGVTALALSSIACSSSDSNSDPVSAPIDAASDPDGAVSTDADGAVSTDADGSVSTDADGAVSTDADGSVSTETGLPICPNEIDLKGISLPCDCYGHEANATTIVDPNCKTQVVCCPTIANLRCEDHEYCDDAGNCWDAATVPDSASGDAAPKCKDEVDLAKEPLPCDCYGTLVTDPKVSMPSCTAKVMCCPVDKGLKCE